MVSGLDLRVERVKAGATQRDVARHMSVSAARISVIERSGNTPGTALEEETAARYRQALADIKAERKSQEPTTERHELIAPSFPYSLRQQYIVAKGEARHLIRTRPWVRRLELVIHPETPAAVVLGYLDGIAAAGGSCTLLDSSGTILNRRIG